MLKDQLLKPLGHAFLTLLLSLGCRDTGPKLHFITINHFLPPPPPVSVHCICALHPCAVPMRSSTTTAACGVGIGQQEQQQQHSTNIAPPAEGAKRIVNAINRWRQKLHFFDVFWLFREIQEGFPGIFLAHNHFFYLLNIFAFGSSPRYCFVIKKYGLKLRTHIHPHRKLPG